jgi:hypothetical protein
MDAIDSYKQDACYGIMEVRGQQTFMKAFTDITGDANTISIIYSHTIEGSGKNLKKGDTLFVCLRIMRN